MRECARQSVVELFTGPGVTDAARADLKNAMAKKNVRKTIVDGVLQRVLAGGGTASPAGGSEFGSDHGEASTGGTGYVPPSIALKSKRPGATGISKSSSQREISRPISRAATASPVPGEGGNNGGSSDVKAVYVGISQNSCSDLEL